MTRVCCGRGLTPRPTRRRMIEARAGLGRRRRRTTGRQSASQRSGLGVSFGGPSGGSLRTATAVIERDPDLGLCVGHIPGWPGAHSQGASLDELQQNLRDVIAILLEDGEPQRETEFIGTQTLQVARRWGRSPPLKPREVVTIVPTLGFAKCASAAPTNSFAIATVVRPGCRFMPGVTSRRPWCAKPLEALGCSTRSLSGIVGEAP